MNLTPKQYIAALEQEVENLRQTAQEFDMFMKWAIREHGEDGKLTILGQTLREAAHDTGVIKVTHTDPPLACLVYELCEPLPPASSNGLIILPK